jgi:hypothetical protein
MTEILRCGWCKMTHTRAVRPGVYQCLDASCKGFGKRQTFADDPALMSHKRVMDYLNSVLIQLEDAYNDFPNGRAYRAVVDLQDAITLARLAGAR